MSHHDPADAELADLRLTARLLRAHGEPSGITCRRLGRLRGLFHPAAGGAGADVPFGFVLQGEAYFKAGPEHVTKYIARGMSPFVPADARHPLRGYWRVPPDVLDDEPTLRQWAAWAVDAAGRFGKRPRRRPGVGANVARHNGRGRVRRDDPPVDPAVGGDLVAGKPIKRRPTGWRTSG